MATVYGTGNSTVTVEWCSAFCYAFSHNVIQITLGSDFSATEQVNLSFGSFSSSRNCVNRKCTFDMAGAFQALFSFLRFSPTYATQDDVFLVSDTIELLIDGFATTMEQATSVRWGALQIGETAYQNKTIPFYSGKELMGNCVSGNIMYVEFFNNGSLSWADLYSSKKIYKIVPLTTPISYDKIIVQYKQDASVLETITYELDCAPDYYLRWIDALGRIWYIGLDKSKETEQQSEIKVGQKIKLYGSGDRPTSKTNKRTIRAGKQSISKELYDHLTSLAESPLVWLEKGGQWIVVNIADSSFAPKTDELSDFDCVIELPENYTVSL